MSDSLHGQPLRLTEGARRGALRACLSMLLLLPALGAAKPFDVKTFSPWAGYGIPNGVWLTADLNGDGKTDLVHVVNGADYVHTWISKGDGTFTMGTFRPWAGYGMPNGVWLAADLNGDGKTDLVHVVNGTDYVHTWISRGDGTFTVGTFRPWAGYGMPNGVWLAADLNGDGKTDLVHVVNGADYVHTWLSNGNGTFTVGTFRPWAGYGMPNGVWLAGDFNGDGKTDLVHAVQGTDYAHVWLSRGTGAFDVLTFSPWAGYAIPNGLWMAGDFSGDKRADIVHAVQGRDYVHTWISTLPRPGEVALDGLEITQSVQDMGQTVPLVAAKTSVARAYLSANVSAPLTVRGILSGRRAGGAWSTVASANTVTVNPAQNFQLRTKREDVNLSLNFPLPAGWTASGIEEARLSAVNDVGGAARGCSDCATSPLSVQFQTSAPGRVRVIGLQYTSGTPPQSFTPRALDFTLLGSWLRRAYPIPSLQYSTNTVAATNNPWTFSCGDSNAQVATIRANEVNAVGTSHVDRRSHYYGMLSDGGGFTRGCAASIPGGPDPGAVASGPTGAGNWGWDNDGSYGDWYGGHELGHTFGRFHPGSGCGESADDPSYPYPNGHLSNADGAFVGFDVGDAANAIGMTAHPGFVWADMMTYCQRLWISNYTYGHIRDRLNGENVLPAGAPQPLMVAGALPLAPTAQRPARVVIGETPSRILGQSAPVAIPEAAGAAPRIVAAAREAPPAIIEAAEGKPILTATVAAGTGPAAIPAVAMGARPVAPPTLNVAAAGEPQRAPPAAYSGPPPVLRGYHMVPVEQRAAGATGQGPVELKQGDLLSVVATVNITKKTAKLRYLTRVQRALPEATAVPAVEEALVRYLDGAGRPMKAIPVPLRRDSDIPAGEDQTGLVDAVVPFVAGAAKVELLVFGEVVDTRGISTTPPKVGKLKSEREAGALAAPGGVTFTWEASGAESYTVLASSDGGKTWQTVAMGLKEPRLRLDPAAFPEATSVLVRVVASDGVNTSAVTSAQPVRLR